MAPTDVAAAEALARTVLWARHPAAEDRETIERGVRRVAHLQRTDPGGAWVAEAGGAIIGMAIALVREGIWGLSLFAVARDHQSRGIGREPVEAALRHRAGPRGDPLLPSERPAA